MNPAQLVAWLRNIGIGVLLVWVLALLLFNSRSAEIWYAPWAPTVQMHVVLLALISFGFGVICTLLAVATARGMSGRRRDRGRRASRRLDDELAEMERKAAMLRTSPTRPIPAPDPPVEPAPKKPADPPP